MNTNETLRRLPWWVIAFVVLLVLFALFTRTMVPNHVNRPQHVYFSDH